MLLNDCLGFFLITEDKTLYISLITVILITIIWFLNLLLYMDAKPLNDG